MKLHECVQGTTQWLALRKGIPTASQFDKIITPKGKPSASAEKYLFALIAERLLGRPLTEHISFWMERGSEMEQDAVDFYEMQRDCDTEPVGFVTNDDGTIGASPDRFVGTDGCLEIKCPKEAIHISYLMQDGGAYSDYKIQAQGQLWIAERQWVDVLSFHPELPPALVRIVRDEDFIESLSLMVEAFSRTLEEQFSGLQARLAA